MKTRIEISDLREYNRILNGYKNLDKTYTFYYDETNNFRKFYVKEDIFNSSSESNFILGGVLHENKSCTDDINELMDLLKLQQNSIELKLIHIAKGDFFKILKSKKLNHFLKWLFKSSLYVHCSSLNFLYYSVVDIVDSVIRNFEKYKELDRGYIDLMKNNLYSIAKIEKKSIIKLFYKFEYPNIKKEKVNDFINGLVDIISPYEEIEDFSVGIASLRQLLNLSNKTNTLLYIMDNEDYVLLKDFTSIFINRISMFINSEHIFDKEDNIEEIINSFDILNNGEIVDSYSFVNSKDNKLIQISDVFIGVLGKFSIFINNNSIKTLENEISKMNPIQIENLNLLENILNKSINKNKAFLHSVDSFEENEKYEFVEYLIKKNGIFV